MFTEYGKTLRMIRKQKGITLERLADGVCSVSFLSKFERGESDITLGLMTRLLENIMMNFDEFLYIHHDYQPDKLEQFFKTTQSAYLNRDVDQLRKLKDVQLKKWKQYGVETYHYNALLIEVYESIVDKDYIDKGVQESDIRLLSDYLFRVEVWGYYELMLYNGTLLLLHPDLVIMLSRTAYEKSARFRDYAKVNDAITSVLFNTIVFLIGPVNRFHEEFTYQKEISEFFGYLETVAIPESNLIERVYLLQLKGAYDMRTGKIEVGTEKMNQAIELLKDLNSTKMANNMEQFLMQIKQFL
ncbi:helix-turn-helix domain-containing protein [Ornithinibacillus halophilus]|uniref:Transcriptional activator, Rgg/GadR/MutR family, C-terminal domain-containing protein n=1 Tax=Ornithinibacillus halophilus TaxID=930117 RepID=A0A1M5L0N7_9BACI|nr:Rgg/GadR/MutR family transcriptional regulator [Ornithinibacillus halophilus]SHG58662.1 transcriptional activator, Rgg/GadR/MutR family, C-terminal domain-containing protein [Ornithinibacillus halophilus]